MLAFAVIGGINIHIQGRRGSVPRGGPDTMLWASFRGWRGRGVRKGCEDTGSELGGDGARYSGRKGITTTGTAAAVCGLRAG